MLLPSAPSAAKSCLHPAPLRWRARPARRAGRKVRKNSPARRLADRNCQIVAQLTAAAFGVPVREVTAASRGEHHVAFARQCAMYLAHVSFGMSYGEIGCAFRRDRTTAAHACRQVEDRRDRPAIDALLNLLESACRIHRRRFAPQVQP